MSASKRPGFEQFRDALIALIKEHVKQEEIDPFSPWLHVGDESTREAILHAFKSRMESTYGVELVVEPHLVSLDRPVESIAVQLHHVFNTIFLMEQINARIRARLKKSR
ncbi:hypothetical protein J2Z49_000773 [Desulfofundulus luciae]|uniref:Uncharacterized protein n=1 Tax=Desulfofundulus luciae TaxID=74702 RepID=A0ABU0B049_9FIRM|nr:hypothetical protein [Desulfofundulus luciae]MDQ0285669.1 hypothetical protein [Desulfofundulus luciae]